MKKKFSFLFLFLSCFNLKSDVALTSSVPNDTSVFSLSNESAHREAYRVGSYLDISNPGYYYLISDIKVPKDTRSVDDIPIIKITSSNIVLDLNGHSITHVKGKNIVGIQIEENLSNVEIRGGGRIHNIIGTGLLIKGNNETVRLRDLTISNITGAPLKCFSSNIINVSNLNIFSSNNKASIYGAYFENCKNVRVENSEALICKSSTDEAVGFFLNKCSTGSFDNVRSSQHEGMSTSGYKIIDSEYFIFRRVRSLNNFARNGDLIGFNFLRGRSHRLVSCTGVGGQSSKGHIYGILLKDGDSSKVENCTIRNCISISQDNVCKAVGLGILGDEKFAVVENCEFISNNGGNGVGYGILIDGGSFCTVSNNKILYNHGLKNGYGIRDTAEKSKSFFYSNLAHGNGTPEKCVINNYDISPAPYSDRSKFPSEIGLLSDFSLVGSKGGYKNYEFIEEKK